MLKPEWGVDLIIGGHTHTVLEKPEIVAFNRSGQYRHRCNQGDIDVDTDNNCIDTFTWKFIPITDKNCQRLSD